MLKTYTIFAAWTYPEGDRDVEEVDVHAESDREARKLAESILARDYMPGWKIIHVEPRVNGTYFF